MISSQWGTVVERPFAEDGTYWVLRANGGIHSTSWDMLRWGQALLADQALSVESMAAYWSPHVDEGGGESFYGYGWVVLDMGGTRVITHNGGNGILFADMAIVPAAELVMVIQTNVVGDFQVAQLLLEQLGGRLLMGRALPRVPDRDPEPSADLGRLAGSYRVAGGGELRVTAAERELAIEASDPRAFAALPAREGWGSPAPLAGDRPAAQGSIALRLSALAPLIQTLLRVAAPELPNRVAGALGDLAGGLESARLGIWYEEDALRLRSRIRFGDQVAAEDAS